MRQLSNGMLVIFKRVTTNNILAMDCLINIGSLYEDSDDNGITNFVQEVILKGTKHRSAVQIAREMESIGGLLGTNAAEDFAEVSTVTTTEDLDTALDIMSDVLLHPTFPPEEVEKERQLILAHINLQEDDKFAYTYKKFRETLYEGHTYANPVEGTPKTVTVLTRDALQEFHRRYWVPANMTLTVVGNFDEEELLGRLNVAFGKKPTSSPTKVISSKTFLPRYKSKILKKKVEQSFIILGYLTVSVDSPDYPALKVASAILGEGMSSRLFQRLREAQGLAYNVGCAMPTRLRHSHIFAWIGTNPDTTDAAREGLIKQFELLASEPVTDEELNRAKNYLIGKFLIDHQTNLRQAWYLGWFQLLGVGYDFDKRYPELIRQVTKDDVLRVARTYFTKPTVAVLTPP
jgi:zinc protease